jgi:Protein of unknown function (DUF3618)
VSSQPEPARPSTAGTPGRTPEQIRRDIEIERTELSRSVESLRGRVAELTDWRRQVREHRSQLVAAAAIGGFVVGVMALRRRGRG